jgi:L-threonylcarbamoyladenylate synthase
MDSREIDRVLQKWGAGEILVHPTDSVPGLSVNPRKANAISKLLRAKGYEQTRPFVNLIANYSQARLFWEPLPLGWDVLSEVWPASLTVIWRGRIEKTPEAVMSADCGLALRCPSFPGELSWMQTLLEGVDDLFPTTSVNFCGRPPATNWEKALNNIKEHSIKCYVPQFEYSDLLIGVPSTVLKITGDFKYELIRQGSFSVDILHQKWGEFDDAK